MSTTPPKEDKTDDPLGIGIESTKLYIGVGSCVCLVLLCIIPSKHMTLHQYTV